jgi:hypothetical protein
VLASLPVSLTLPPIIPLPAPVSLS